MEDWKYIGPAETAAPNPGWKYISPEKEASASVTAAPPVPMSSISVPVSPRTPPRDSFARSTETAQASPLPKQPSAPTPMGSSTFETSKQPTAWSPEATSPEYRHSGFSFPDLSTVRARISGLVNNFDIRSPLPTQGRSNGSAAIEPVPFSNLQAVVGKNVEMPQRGTSVKVDTTNHNLTVFVDGTPIKTYSVAVGAPKTQTPIGRFTVKENPSIEEMKANDDYDYYHRWLGFHTISYDAGTGNYPQSQEPYDAYYGIHGTPHPESIGKDASHGCIRMRYDDVEDLAKLIKVDTPVIITKGSH